MKMIFIVPLLVGSLIVAFCFFNSGNDSKRKESKKYLGYYKLDRLNGENCENCKLNLLEDNHYDIIVNNQIKGRGKWDLDFDGESAGYYLVLENGPHNMIFDTPREIGYINTKDR